MANMKINQLFLGALVLGAFSAAHAQPAVHGHFTLKGTLNGTHVDSAILNYPGAKAYIRIAKAVIDGRFSFTGALPEVAQASIEFTNKGEVIPMRELMNRERFFYLEPGLISVTGNPSDMKSLKFTGSKVEKEFEAFNAGIQPILDEMKPLEDAIEKEKDHEKAAALHEKFGPYQERMKLAAYKFFITHPTSQVTLDQMRYYVTGMGMDTVKRIYQAFTAKQKDSETGKEIKNTIEAFDATAPGKMAPFFSRKDINGNPLALTDFRGKYVLVDFWASWCVPCRKGIPHLKELYNKYKAQGFDVIGVADDDSRPEAWHKAVEQDGSGIWHHILRGLDMEKIQKHISNPNDLDQSYAVHSIPVKFLIGPDGRIVGRYGDNFGESDAALDEKLKSIYGR